MLFCRQVQFFYSGFQFFLQNSLKAISIASLVDGQSFHFRNLNGKRREFRTINKLKEHLVDGFNVFQGTYHSLLYHVIFFYDTCFNFKVVLENEGSLVVVSYTFCCPFNLVFKVVGV